ncbi:hypothetical protein QCM77_43030, partial [Bradyrhizobium sp. SSUT18]|uniref:hypothetical protein n=1 Tax=Bradyrhizobium sp. SSUT18 TaxID=3040602 RepID=UPI002449B710
PALPDKLDSLDLELSTELSSSHHYLRLHETPKLGVHQTGSSSMQPMLRFEATAQLHVLISDLRRRVQLLDADIEEEERKSRVFNPANHSYPMLALSLRERRDNLQTTVATLQKQLTILPPASERAA